MKWLTRDSAIRVRARIGFVVDSREIALWWSRGVGTVRLDLAGDLNVQPLCPERGHVGSLEIGTCNPRPEGIDLPF